MAEQHLSWTATTAQEAIDILDAASRLIEAGMLALVPGDGVARRKAQQTTPFHVTVTLDDAALAQLIADRHASPAGSAL